VIEAIVLRITINSEIEERKIRVRGSGKTEE